MQVPDFIARQFYVKGSLRNDADGFRLGARNPLGDGTIVGVGRIAVDGAPIDPASISAVRDGGERIEATAVSRTDPIRVSKGDTITLHVRAAPLAAGEHQLDVELLERDLGALRFRIRDRLSEG